MNKGSLRHYKGAIHLHTTLSHDGVLTLPELANFIRSKGYDFMAVTEHSQDMTEAKLAELAKGAAVLSGDAFLIIPGIEFNCTGTIHILGLGITKLCSSDNPPDVIDHIHVNGGLAVLAHPSNKDYPIDLAWVKKLDGCEIWNNRHGKWLPQMHAVRKFEELSHGAPGLKAYAGLDLHSPVGYSHVAMEVEADSLARRSILSALENGQCHAGGKLLQLPCSGKLGLHKRFYLLGMRSILNVLRWFWHKASARMTA